MGKRRTFKLLGVIVAILLISVAYAAIQDVTFTLTGQVTSTPDQANFKVAFTGTPTQSGIGTAVLNITGDLTATMNVSGLTKVGDTLTAKFIVANTSKDLTAYLSKTVTNTNTEYFEVTSSLDSTELEPLTGTTNLNIIVKLIKTPVTENQTDTLKVEVIASPTKPEVPLISFTINNSMGEEITWYAEQGMTWEQWITSKYCNSEVWTANGSYVYFDATGNSAFSGEEVLVDSNGFILPTDLIEDGRHYGTMGY